MVRTRSSRFRVQKGQNTNKLNPAESSALAQIQRINHREHLKDAVSELTSTSQDDDQNAHTTLYGMIDDLAGVVSNEGETTGQNVSSVCTGPGKCSATEPAPMAHGTAPVICSASNKDGTNRDIPEANGFNEEADDDGRVDSGSDSIVESCRSRMIPGTFSVSKKREDDSSQHRDCEPQDRLHERIEDASHVDETSYNGKKSHESFAWLIQTGQVIAINLLDTIPLNCVRKISASGVLKLEKAFLRSEDGPGMSMGVSYAAPQAVVVEIQEERIHIVQEYFVEEKRISEENSHALSRSKKWYGIVEGAHRRKALINLSEKHPERFKGYSWIVLRVNWQPLDVLRAFARERNEFQKRAHLIEFTIHEVFKNLKQCADDLAVREGLVDGRAKNRGYLKRVADWYCGGVDTANKLTRQLAGVAVVLSWSVIEVMGEVLNAEYPEAAKAIDPDTMDGDNSDARMCRNLFTKSTFRGATTFKTVATEQDQINTLRRLLFLAPQREYKPKTTQELETQTKKAIAARREVERMEKKLQGHDWPVDMAAIRQALLTKPLLDDQVEENKNSAQLLPELQELWESQFPLAAELEDANKNGNISDMEQSSSSNLSGIELVPSHDDIFTDELEDSQQRMENDASVSENPFHNSATCESGDAEDNVVGIEHSEEKEVSSKQNATVSTGNGTEGNSEDAEEEEKLCPLKQLSVRAENKTWCQFEVTLLSEELFDIIYADPQQSLSAGDLKQELWTEFKDEKKNLEFAKFCRISLRPGCFCFVFLLAEEFSSWASAFQKEGMKVMKSPFMVIPRPDSARTTRLKDLPQPYGELAIVAESPETCSGFNINFKGSYGRIECSHTRKFGIIDNDPRCLNPLRAGKSYGRIECSHTRKFGIIDNDPRCLNPLRAGKSRAEVRP